MGRGRKEELCEMDIFYFFVGVSFFFFGGLVLEIQPFKMGLNLAN